LSCHIALFTQSGQGISVEEKIAIAAQNQVEEKRGKL